jgi:hypothetical protein
LSRLRLLVRCGGLVPLGLAALLAACGPIENSDGNSNDYLLNDQEAAKLAESEPEVRADGNYLAANPGAGGNVTGEANRTSSQVAANEQDSNHFDLNQAQDRIEGLERRVTEQGNRLSQLPRTPRSDAPVPPAERPLPAYWLVLALIAVVALGYWDWRRRKDADKEPFDVGATSGRLDKVEARLSALEARSDTPSRQPSQPAAAVAVSSQPGITQARHPEEPKARPRQETIESDPVLPPLPELADQAQERRSTAIGAAFTHMASKKMPTREDYDMALRSFGKLYDAGVREGRVELYSFTGGSATTLLAAIDLSQGVYALIPSYYFVKEFDITYHEAIEAATFLKGIFTLEKDNTLTLKCTRAALARSGAADELTLVQPGTLGGFTRAR